MFFTNIISSTRCYDGPQALGVDMANMTDITDDPIEFTVAIPTYNGAQRLPTVLNALRSQTTPTDIRWEVLVIDNNSQDHVKQVVKDHQAQWPEDSSLSYHFEPQQGLAYARECAIRHAQGTWIGFIDDDVIPEQDWISQAVTFGRSHPRAGAYGGQVHGAFESPPPEGFERIKSFLALRENGNKPKLYNPTFLSMPSGAALVVRKHAWQKHVPDQLTLVGRINGQMISGEDYEALLHIHQANWQVWHCPTMHAYHQIPATRLERDYLVKIARGCGLCVCDLRLVGVKPHKKPLIVLKLILGNLYRLLRHLVQYRQRAFTDLVASCEKEYMISALISPILMLRRTINGFSN